MVEPLRVLVVEDQPDIAELLCITLDQLGHQPTVANDGATALALADQVTPDLILLDIGLPDIIGYEVARILRARGSSAFIAAVTGWGRAEDRARTLEAGIDRHIIKPAKRDSLIEVVNEALRLRNARARGSS